MRASTALRTQRILVHMRSVALGALVVVAAACSGSPDREVAAGSANPPTAPPAVSDAERTARIEHGLRPAIEVTGEDVRYSIDERMRRLNINAVSIAVFENYRVVWAHAYGAADAESHLAATTETLFQAGSISKSIHAIAVLEAVADGTLPGLDAPIDDALTTWKLPDNALTKAAPVTLRRLLSHTAGTTVHGFPGYVAGAPLPSLVQILDGQPPANTPAIRVDLAPGTRYRYSGGGITITQLALTDRAKQPYPTILASRVLGPLGMTHSTYEQPLPDPRVAHAAAGYTSEGAPIEGKRHVYPEMAAAGLWTTPSDLARAFAEIGRARANRSTTIAHDIAMQMTTRVMALPGDAQSVGLGVFLSSRNGAAMFGHNGADDGFQADAVASLDGGYGVVVMANSDNGSRLFPEVERAVFAAYDWPGQDPALPRATLDAAARARFVGRYADADGALTIAEVGDRLVLRPALGETFELVPVTADTVAVRDDGVRLAIDLTGGVRLVPPGGLPKLVPRLADGATTPLLELEAGHFDAAVAAWRAHPPANAEAALAWETQTNQLGYALARTNPRAAIDVLRLVATVAPDSSNAHDSLGEIEARTGDVASARAEYAKALAALDADPRIAPRDKAARRAYETTTLAKLR